jgi:hypothetical protein
MGNVPVTLADTVSIAEKARNDQLIDWAVREFAGITGLGLRARNIGDLERPAESLIGEWAGAHLHIGWWDDQRPYADVVAHCATCRCYVSTGRRSLFSLRDVTAATWDGYEPTTDRCFSCRWVYETAAAADRLSGRFSKLRRVLSGYAGVDFDSVRARRRALEHGAGDLPVRR